MIPPRSAFGAPPQGGAASGPAKPVPLQPLDLAVRSSPRGVPVRQPVHPGRFLQRHYLSPLQLTQTEAAHLLGVSRRRLHEIVHGQRSLTPDTALRCALAFGADASFWLALQSAWDSFHAWKRMRLHQRRPISST